jgi:hypothetical protein
LEREGHEIEEKYPGIYYVTNKLPIPAQIVVTSELSKETHSCLRILSDNAEKEDVERFLEQAKGMQSPGERNNIDSVLQVSVSANNDLYEDIRVQDVRWTSVLHRPKWKWRGMRSCVRH